MLILFWLALMLQPPPDTIQIVVERHYLGQHYTIGHLYINGKYFCETLEDVVRPFNHCVNKVYGKTAIPFGIYDVSLTYAPHFKRMLPWIRDVPCFSGILIHAGHCARQTKGCILVGINDSKGHLSHCLWYEKELVKRLKKKPVIKIIIRNHSN